TKRRPHPLDLPRSHRGQLRSSPTTDYAFDGLGGKACALGPGGNVAEGPGGYVLAPCCAGPSPIWMVSSVTTTPVACRICSVCSAVRAITMACLSSVLSVIDLLGPPGATSRFWPRSRRRPLSATQHHPTPSLIDISWHCNEP